MSGLITLSQQAAAMFLQALAASLAIALFAPAVVIAAPGIPEDLSGEYSSECVEGGEIIDPVGVLFRGKQAGAKKAAFEVNRAAEWEHEGWGDQKLKVKIKKGELRCRNVSVQPASEVEFNIKPWEAIPTPLEPFPHPFDVIDVPEERFHVRLWFIPASANANERKTVGTPHFEEFIKWEGGDGNNCKGKIKVEVKGITITAKGGHAVTEGGGESEMDSGFDLGRQELRRSMENTAHKDNIDSEKWGNDTLVEQCSEEFAGSNGNGITIGMDWVKAGVTGRPKARQSSARLLGRLETTEKSTEWWFEYGPTSSEGAGTYAKKTSVKSVAEPTEVDVQQPIVGLSPGSSYYVRMFVRDKEGKVEEGNEVKFETCGYEEGDEDDGSKGPRVTTPECGGVVDAFYRDVNGDLGHQSWTPEETWSTETQPASIHRSAIPRVVHRSDGSSVVDVFYREADGDLGHQWWTPGSGWQAEQRSVSMASDPNVVIQPNGTIDVFYRTSENKLGHEWWVPESGWSSEVRSTTLSSKPHAVAHADGSIDVIYRDGSGLGRDSWTSKSGWTHEVRSASLVAEPRPLAGKEGAIDVFYRTAENKLGHDWFVPGEGWSREIRPASLASDPHVVTRPNGTIDVFYRTSGDELGHDWWVSGSGWSTETRPGNLSSDPHAVARGDGSVEVFYRDGNRLGHQWFVPGTGWSVESRPGPIAWHTDPHVVTQSNGRIDVIYETPTEQLGRDWYMPGVGWAHEIRPMRRPSRPVAAYSFDAGEGAVAKDLFGNHDGTLKNTEWVNGKYGSAIYLDGNDDYLEIPDSSELALSEEFTVEAWVRPDEDATWESVIWKETQNYYSYSLMAGGETAGVPEGFLAAKAGSWVDVEGEEDLPDTAWSHLAVTYDGANLRLYVDGELVDTEAASPNSEISEGKLFFGTNDDEDFFNGRIDEVRLYNRALDAAEIAADKATPVQTQPTSPVAAYPFDDGDGEDEEEGEGENEFASDLFGNHDGEIEGAAWAKGRYGSALLFDEEDCVTVADASDLQLTEDFTLEAWVKPDDDQIQDDPIFFQGNRKLL